MTLSLSRWGLGHCFRVVCLFMHVYICAYVCARAERFLTDLPLTSSFLLKLDSLSLGLELSTSGGDILSSDGQVRFCGCC